MGILGGFGEFFGSLFAPQAVEQRNVSPAGAKIQVLDAIHPRKLCLGTKAWPSSIMWHNSHRWGGGDTPRDTYTMVLALSDQLSGPIQAIWLDNERFTVGTNTSSGGSGQDFVPTSNFTSQWSSNPTGFNAWYGPNLNKVPVSSRLAKHVREDGGSFRSDIQFRYFDGSQTAADDLLNQLPNYQTDNGVAQSRVFRRITYLAVSLRAGLSTVGGGGNFGGSDIGPRVPAILVESRGNREVYDWRTGTVSYSENAALCMARWMMWEYGPLARVDDNFDLLYPLPSDFSVDDMSFAADLCDQNVTILSGSATQARYQVDAEIEADRSASNIFEQFSFALGGVKVFRRQSTGKWVIRPGHYAPPVMTIPERDYLPGPVRTRHRTPRQERKNGIQVKYTSQNQAYELVDSEIVTDSDYLAEDGGAPEAAHVQGRFRGRQAPCRAFGADLASDASTSEDPPGGVSARRRGGRRFEQSRRDPARAGRQRQDQQRALRLRRPAVHGRDQGLRSADRRDRARSSGRPARGSSTTTGTTGRTTRPIPRGRTGGVRTSWPSSRTWTGS